MPLPSRRSLAALLLLISGSLSAADDLGSVQSLVRQGRYEEALQQTDRLISANPKDRSARLTKGVILTELKRPNEAITVFQKLTQDFPELPEPYNNLAVIYAQQRQYDKAKAALEQAIRTHPSFATAHENLGDLYARMASQAYDRALQIEGANSQAEAKLALIREIVAVGGRPASSAPTLAAQNNSSAATTKAANSAATTPPPATAAPTPLPPPKSAPPASAAAPAPSMPAPAPSMPAPAAAPPAKAPTEAARQALAAAPAVTVAPAVSATVTKDSDADIAKAVQAWAAAWSRKDLKSYFGAYAKDFQAPDGNRGAWMKEREQRVGKPGKIEVKVDKLVISVDGDRATVRFRQHYRSANFDSSTGKTLVLVRRGNRWLIEQERVGS